MFKVDVVLMYICDANTDEIGCTYTHTHTDKHTHILTDTKLFIYIDIDT